MKTVSLATLENNIQATMLKDLLLNEGIESFTKNETLSSVMDISSFKIEMDVFEEDYDKALEILKRAFPNLVDE